jgi:hypothetical protein
MLAEMVAGLDVMACEKFADVHRSFPFGLKLENLEMAVARCDAQFVGMRGDYNARVRMSGST